MSYFQQLPYSIRLEWGAAAIHNLGQQVDCIVVIDVMSFSSCVNIAVERGAKIYPYPWRDERAQLYAQERGAAVASSKRRFADGWSLSPRSMLGVSEGLKLVLPSPNGSACAYLARELGKTVYCASLRNLAATAIACQGHKRILVVACGERWDGDNSFRPCLEDYLAAGGLISAIGRADMSPESLFAAQAYRASQSTLAGLLATCSSAIELAERGFSEDVALCLEVDISRVACRLDGDCFVEEPMA